MNVFFIYLTGGEVESWRCCKMYCSVSNAYVWFFLLNLFFFSYSCKLKNRYKIKHFNGIEKKNQQTNVSFWHKWKINYKRFIQRYSRLIGKNLGMVESNFSIGNQDLLLYQIHRMFLCYTYKIFLSVAKKIF